MNSVRILQFSAAGAALSLATVVAAQAPDCAALPAAAPAGLTVTAEAVAADSLRPPGVNAGPLLVAHCRVAGRMAERTGIDGKPCYIGFEMRLPLQWNGRLLC
jgi:hypothetical protein